MWPTTSFHIRPALLTTALCLVAATPAHGRPLRRLFEPTDLDLEDPGTLELDTQVGLLRGHDPYRLSIPDFELDLGLTPNVEVDIDGALALEGPDSGALSFARIAPDNLWVAAKIGVWDAHDPDTGLTWAIGLQVGPKLPTARGVHGFGIEGLLLATVHNDSLFLTLSAGGLLDPAGGDSGRPQGVEGGVDLASALDKARKWSLTAEIGGIHFSTDDPNQLAFTTGVAYSPSESVKLSIVVLGGLLPGSDRFGVLLGVSPAFRLWKRH